ncbi:rRNA processing/ribosome biogenesis-domain-containing protein [Sordaria brevicollis]|uniref:Pre-rRNA-processing protein RIX1 n=1 Tax=Sordaria brevicollis TaxID=83679 RepID=A0AAE0NUY6_SORBR|nr:rRNA processing/ribosome biogenesis-domain-containing protein [Sordaria brevicollis]
MSIPPSDLRVLCRRLASTPVDDLPHICPLLVSQVLRCGEALSAVPETKAKDKSSESATLVHRLRTHITTLLTGKSASGRFAAVSLVKAVVDVGGWESLRASDAWIRGLIAILGKPDPLVSKELCVITLTKIYSLLQGYQTLIREMATPTLPSFVTAMLNLVKPPASSKAPKVPASFVDIIAGSLAKIVALYPTTTRPFNSQIRAAFKAYVAPTMTDATIVPQSLRESARALLVVLHYTAPKNGSSDEWAKGIKNYIKEAHATADQVFRAVRESWESTAGYRVDMVRTDGEPFGGGNEADELPAWTGVTAGSERLAGLIGQLIEYLRVSTKAPVVVPVGELLDLASRITLITLPKPTTGEDSIETNPAISRDEKAELWSVLPEVHMAVLNLHTVLLGRLGANAVPLATDILDQMVRVFTSGRHIAAIRETVYVLAKDLLEISGPGLLKLNVDSMVPVIQSTCQDILRATGHFSDSSAGGPSATNSNPNPKKPTAGKTGAGIMNKPAQASSNADAFLTSSSSSSILSTDPTTNPLFSAALSLLPLFLSRLPQRHLSPEARGLIDRTAILANSKAAMLASVLNPYKDTRGRYYPTILPFLVRQFPADQEVEVLRTNLMRVGAGVSQQVATSWNPEEGLEELAATAGKTAGDKEEDEDEEMVDAEGEDKEDNGDKEADAQLAAEDKKSKAAAAGAWGAASSATAEKSAAEESKPNPFATVTVAEESKSTRASAKKRKVEEEAATPAKRVTRSSRRKTLDVEEETSAATTTTTVEVVEEVAMSAEVPNPAKPVVAVMEEKKGEDDEDSDSDAESVQIDMSLEDSEDEEEEE